MLRILYYLCTKSGKISAKRGVGLHYVMGVHYVFCVYSAQPEVAAVLDWYGPEADPAYWQRGREEVAGLQVYSVQSTQSIYM